MRKIQNKNLSFRCPESLKDRIKEYAIENEMHLSNAIRGAINDFVKSKKSRLEITSFGVQNNAK